MLENSLSDVVKITKNAHPDKYSCSGYCIRYDAHGFLSMSDNSGNGKNVVIVFGADMSSSVHIDNKKIDILIIGKGPADGLHDTTTLTANTEYTINFSNQQKGFRLTLHYNKSKFFYL